MPGQKLKFIGSDARSENDSFRRRELAKAWANSLYTSTADECLVVGIEGEWGAGKSTFADYLLDEIESQNPKPIVIRFDPWLFGSVEEVIRQFFQQLRNELAKHKESRSRWKNIPEIDYDSILDGMSILLSIGELSPVGSNYFNLGNRGLSFLRRPKAKGKKTAGSLVEQKKQLDEVFGELKGRVVVLIDDIDRLEPESAAAILQLVRMNASFPHFTYILPYDAEMLGRAIDSAYSIENGRGYVEKVVTLPLMLPNPSAEDLRRFFIEQLVDPFVDEATPLNGVEKWRQVLDLTVGTQLTTPRQIIRLRNILVASYEPIKKDVDLRDFILIESIRLQSPVIHRYIWENPWLFLGHRDLLSSNVEKSPDVKKNVESSREEFKARLSKLGISIDMLDHLFPAFGAIGTHNRYDQGRVSDSRTNKRIASHDHFEMYFSFSLPQTTVPESKLGELVNTVNLDELVQKLIELINGPSARDLLTQQPPYTQNLTSEQATLHFQAIIRVADQLSFYEYRAGFSDDNLSMVWLAIDALSQIEHEKRVEFIVNLIKQSGNIGTLVRLVDLLEGKEDEPFTTSELDSIKKEMGKVLDSRAKSGTLFDENPPLGAINYFRWLDYGLESDEELAIRNSLVDPDSAANLLRSFVSVRTSTSGTGQVSKTRYVQESGIPDSAKLILNEWLSTNLESTSLSESDKMLWRQYLDPNVRQDQFT
ncbi:KAP family P-loop NTPase fold protein [Candidatus Lucifugimonas marina]|uniref:KAP family P-loop NTPase fold protein n=1 Tax=Candidatus Lucifugimonas marina TaxID=3038979 RepID=UPI00319E2003